MRDVAILAVVASCALVLAVWLVGRPPTTGQLVNELALGGLLGSVCGALASASVRAPGPACGEVMVPAAVAWLVRWYPPCPGVAAAWLTQALLGMVGWALPDTTQGRLFAGFLLGVAAWRFLQPKRIVAVGSLPQRGR